METAQTKQIFDTAALEAYTLFSGSSGNAVYIRYNDVRILVDAGMCARTVNRALEQIGSSLKDIDGIFITHEHSDHVKGVEVISSRYHIPIHMTEPSAGRIKCAPEAAVVHPPIYSVRIGEVEVSSFTTPHDSDMSVGFIVSTPDGSIGIATDIGYMTRKIIGLLSGCRAVVLESNHDVEMLKKGPYPYSLKRRILSERGHLSNFDCARCVVHLSNQGVTESVLLAHLSDVNNTPETALKETLCALRVNGCNCKVGVADRYSPTKLI